jgi:tetratricopeptide (TPR) repeat protein
MKSITTLRITHIARASIIAIGLTTMLGSAHAQFGALFQSLMQSTQQQMTQNAAKETAQKQADQELQNAKPVRKFAPVQPVPAVLLSAGQDFAGKTAAVDLRPLFERLYIEGERNATLNFQRIGLAALATGNLDLAEKTLDAAVSRIDQIYADNAEAQKAKSLWTAEKVKDYKGEPYERAMAMFYRGLVYAAKGDFQNARALFKQADYQDTVAEAEQYAGDFGLMPYMAGWASYCDGNNALAKDFVQLAAKGDNNYAGMSAEQPLLVLFETGRAPFKYGAGKFGEVLKWAPHELPAQNVTTACTGTDSNNCVIKQFSTGADVGFQATTRGGRPIDGILGGKASFKEGAQTVANVAGVVGQVGLDTALQTGNRNAGNLGLFGMFAGLVAQGVSASTQAQADIREWEQLPGMVWLGTSANKSDALKLNVAVESNSKKSFVAASRIVDTPSCQLYWGRALSPISLLQDAGPVDAGNHKRDPAFRKELEDSFGG